MLRILVLHLTLSKYEYYTKHVAGWNNKPADWGRDVNNFQRKIDYMTVSPHIALDKTGQEVVKNIPKNALVYRIKTETTSEFKVFLRKIKRAINRYLGN